MKTKTALEIGIGYMPASNEWCVKVFMGNQLLAQEKFKNKKEADNCIEYLYKNSSEFIKLHTNATKVTAYKIT